MTDYEDCLDDIQEAQEYAEGRMCTEQYAVMRCPGDDVTYGAANGCEIRYLEGEGWEPGSPDDGDFTAVLDRLEEDLAVLLLEEDETVVDQYVIKEAALPVEARHQDAVLDVTIQDASLVAADYLEEETEEREKRMQDRFDRLSKRPDDGETNA